MIKLSEEQTLHSSVRYILERHFPPKGDDNFNKHLEIGRLHDISKLITLEVLYVQKQAAIERENEQQKMAAKQSAMSAMGRDTQDAAQIETAGMRVMPEDRTIKSDMRILFINEDTAEHFVGRVYVAMNQK